MAIKLNIGDPASKKTKQFELDDNNAKGLYGKKLGETFKGELVDLPGYEFKITGGSDNAGFPMRPDVEGTRRAKILISHSLGNRKRRKGMRLRKTVAGNTVCERTAQVNAVVVKADKQSLFEEPEEKEAEEKEAEGKEAEGKASQDEAPEKKEAPKE
ncbi:30S ribosomal protein S6e [Candidatus Woesearchaeota archaeon]|nr:MAG: 30S ribosomal protein S6e [Candidatus Woesearchaeota archaeon]